MTKAKMINKDAHQRDSIIMKVLKPLAEKCVLVRYTGRRRVEKEIVRKEIGMSWSSRFGFTF